LDVVVTALRDQIHPGQRIHNLLTTKIKREISCEHGDERHCQRWILVLLHFAGQGSEDLFFDFINTACCPHNHVLNLSGI
jgi:hypothetical protein